MRLLTPILFALLATSAAASPVRDHRVVAELIPVTDAIVPGEPLTVCLNIKHDPKWHTYWKNPGLAGVPTQLKWDLPKGFEAGEIQWARPQRVKMAIYNTFGYEGEVSLLIEIKTPAELQPGAEVTLKTTTTWMMCAETCHPSNAKLSLTIPVRKSSKPHPRGKKLADATRATMPVPNQRWDTSATLAKDSATLTLTNRKNVRPSPTDEKLYFFSDDGLIDSHPEQTITRVSDSQYKLQLPKAEFAPKNPKRLTGILLVESGGKSEAITISAKLAPEP